MGEDKQQNGITDRKFSTLLRNIAIAVIVLLVFLSLPGFCRSHQGHGHDEEPASFKWSREANQAFDSHAEVADPPRPGVKCNHGHDHHEHGHHDHDHHGHQHHQEPHAAHDHSPHAHYQHDHDHHGHSHEHLHGHAAHGHEHHHEARKTTGKPAPGNLTVISICSA